MGKQIQGTTGAKDKGQTGKMTHDNMSHRQEVNLSIYEALRQPMRKKIKITKYCDVHITGLGSVC